MPLYTFRNPKTGKEKDFYFGMNDEKKVNEDGVEWERVWTVPQAAIDTSIETEDQFVMKTRNMKGTLGDLHEHASELSRKRAAKNGGVDPVKEKFYKDYSKKRGGKQHPKQIKEKLAKIEVTI